ncbi:tRNA 2-thiouridine(34) synthase MnmA [Desulfobulbus sp.]|uniref:tRNA 2-thiouridine(34) synthase MnmA n=1 Tax=Desulfobulbus sp. TaxID=895 RepID=UPI0027BA44B2|nr:tRNA 2-thiouridine(34) synthase MnmA [Desulfobulbus sp.]
MTALKVGVAMSGGVDSTMAASLLQEQGHMVHGFFMILPLADLEAQQHRVREAAERLSLPLTLIDLRQPFTEQVIGYFTQSYHTGLTPNPCIRCNRAVKFGLLAEAMLAAGMERVATGHYARIHSDGAQQWVGRGADPGKDQSYFLARLSAAQLRPLLFPLGDWTKAQVRERAAALGFQFGGEESQDVCFLDQGLPAFLAGQGLGDAVGPVLTRDGRQIGEHQGVWHYTIGQRRGLGLPDSTPWYVVELDGAGNRLIVGKNQDLLRVDCTLQSLAWTQTPPTLPWRGLVQLRSRHTPATAELTRTGPEQWRLVFDAPQRAVTPGQFAVFYADDRVLGSAVIAAGPTAEEQA